MSLENITDMAKGPRKRGFHDACGMAHALELIGDRWALFVVRELMLGPRRFSDLRADLPGISANVLTQRLQELEASGLVERAKLPPPASVQVYGLTQWGYEAEPIIQELGRWGCRSLGHDPTLPVSGVSILLSFRTMLDRSRIGNLDFSIGFRFGEVGNLGKVGPDGFTVARGNAEAGDIVFTGHPSALAGFVYGGVPLEALAEVGALTLTGDPMLAARFAALFQLPPKFIPPRQQDVTAP